jgi:SAM-dependent methyltransferase
VAKGRRRLRRCTDGWRFTLIHHPKTLELRDPKIAAAFYDERYTTGYMDSWPPETLDRVREVIKAADLPATGVALDFGCGTGVFTAVLCEALPGWTILGTDVSAGAVAKARSRVPQATFFVEGGGERETVRADFIFSHHVLEHVADLGAARAAMLRYAKQQSRMLHALPCGNLGSLSHTLSSLRRGGIDPEIGNRFFFEDEGHVRRLTTAELVALFKEDGFDLVKSYYSGHWWYTVDYFTRFEPQLAHALTDADHATDREAARRLKRLRILFTFVLLMRRIVQRYENKLHAPLTLRSACMLGAAGIPYLLANTVHLAVSKLARSEWVRRKTDVGGDQMFLIFSRGRA